MALGSIMVDRGYLRRRVRDTHSVQGTRRYTIAEGAQFRCRLDLGGGTERKVQERTSGEVRPRLYALLRDRDRKPLVFRQDDEIRVVSNELGEAIWQIEGEPQPWRKRRRVIGWELQVKRVVDPERAPESGPA